MNDPQQRQPEEKFLDTIVGVFANPVPTLSGVVRRRPIGNVFEFIIVVSIADVIVWVLSLDPLESLDLRIFLIFIFLPVFGIGFMALITGLYRLMSRMFGGSGEYGAMFAGVGFASAPFILSSLVGLLLSSLVGLPAIPLGSGGQSLFGLVQLGVTIGVTIWTIILSVIVVRESNQFSTGRASAAVLISIPPFIGIIIVLLILFAFAVAVVTSL